MSKSSDKLTSERKRTRVIGHPMIPIGMGEHVRSIWRALTEVGENPLLVDIYGPNNPTDSELQALVPHTVRDAGDLINIYCINGDEVDQALRHLRHRNANAPGSVNIISPAWELEMYPSVWAEKLSLFDEVWASSRFSMEAFSREVSVPVIHMPLSCEARRVGLFSRRHFRIPDSAYVFFFAFDFLSYIERKNPFAVIEAFQKMREQLPYADVALVVKTNNSDHNPALKAEFDSKIREFHDRVVVIDRTLSDLEMRGLMWLTDAFVSLHRSEGFGFGIAEAMVMGKPVITTSYSGNMEFCSDTTAFLVPYELIKLNEGDYPHWEGQRWADASTDAAAAVMRDIVVNPEIGRERGRSAKRQMLTNFSYLARGIDYQARLSELKQN